MMTKMFPTTPITKVTTWRTRRKIFTAVGSPFKFGSRSPLETFPSGENVEFMIKLETLILLDFADWSAILLIFLCSFRRVSSGVASNGLVGKLYSKYHVTRNQTNIFFSVLNVNTCHASRKCIFR